MTTKKAPSKAASSRRARATEASDDLLPEYHFDYSKAQPNRFARRIAPGSVAVVLAPDVAKVFGDSESVNTLLRSVIEAMPQGAAGRKGA